MNASTTTATTTNAVTETAPEAVKVKRTWKEVRQLVWAYITFPARKSWEVMCTLTEKAVHASFVAALAVFMCYTVYCGIAYAGFLGRLEAVHAATHDRIVAASTPKSFGSWLYGVTIQPARNLDGAAGRVVGLGE